MNTNIKDLTHIDWTKSSGSGAGTNGCYYKTKVKENGIIYYYKLSAFDISRGFIGNESVYEVIVSRLCKILGIQCADYKIEYVKVKINDEIYYTYACKSKSYRKKNDIAISFEDYYILNKNKSEDLISFINRYKMQNYMNYMIILDYIIINRDRHGANIEILKNSTERFAPLFDNGLSFMCSITKDLYDYSNRIKNFDVMTDIPVNNFIGQRSLLANLDLITAPVKVNKLTKNDKRRIFYGLNKCIDKEHIDMIWKIITYRYSFLRLRKLIVEV